MLTTADEKSKRLASFELHEFGDTAIDDQPGNGGETGEDIFI